MDDILTTSDIILPLNYDESEEYNDDDSDNGTNTSLIEPEYSEESLTDNEEYNRRLRQRISSLKEDIYELKGKLQEEREIWRLEILAKSNCHFQRPDNYCCNTNYDQLAYTHYENKHNLQKQIAYSNYKRRLLEVENMCNLELLRVKQQAECLQPLQNMMTGWGIAAQHMNDMGDSFDLASKKKQVNIKKEMNSIAEVAMPLECFGNKFYSEIIQPAINNTSSSPRLSPPNSAKWTVENKEKYSLSQPVLPSVAENC